MFKNLLNRNKTEPPTPTTEDKLEKLQNGINDLEKQSASLHSEIMATKRPSTRTTLQVERSKILSEIRILVEQKDTLKEKEAIQKITELFYKILKERTLILHVNNHRKRLGKDLTLKLEFTPCGHTKEIHIKELESYRKHIPTNNTQSFLLTKWKANFTTNGVITNSYNCEQCREAKTRKFKLTHTRTAKDIIGICHVSLSIM